MIDHTLQVGGGTEGVRGRRRGQKMRKNEMKYATYFLLDFVDSRIQYMALFISITVCIVILALILLFCYVR